MATSNPGLTRIFSSAQRRGLALGIAVGLAILGTAPAIVHAATKTKSESVKLKPQPVKASTGQRWYAFAQLSEVLLLQSSGGRTLSTDLAWTPEYHFNPSFGMKGDLGLAILNGTSGYFLRTQLLAMGEWTPAPEYRLGAGPGIQTWFSNGGTFFELAVQGTRKFDQPFLKWIDRVVAGYSMIFVSSNLTHELHVGLGFAF